MGVCCETETAFHQGEIHKIKLNQEIQTPTRIEQLKGNELIDFKRKFGD